MTAVWQLRGTGGRPPFSPEWRAKVSILRQPTTAVRSEPASPSRGLIDQIVRGLDNVTAFLALHQYIFLALASVGYFAITGYRAHRRLFWFDEIFTFYISRLPDLASIWSACTHGVDFNPPLLYLLTRWSQDLFGVTELGTRIPQILGFWIFCLCLYRFVSLRTNPLAGFIALLYPLTTGAYWYAYDARSHGVVLGFFGVALISWQAAADRARGKIAPVLWLGASLIGAALCHCYAFILFIPLGIGELTRTILKKRIDTGVWCTFLLAAVVSVITVVPLLRAGRGILTSLEFTTTWASLAASWDLAFNPRVTFVFLLIVSASAVLPHIRRPFAGTTDSDGVNSWTFARYESAALAAILCAPLFVFIAARIGHAPMYGRYSLILTGGVACVIGAVAARSNATGLLVLSMILLTITGGFAKFHREDAAYEPATDLAVSTRVASVSSDADWIASTAPGGDPVVLLNDLTFAPLFHYATSSIRSRLVYLPTDLNGEGYLRLQRCCGAPGTVSARPDFLAAHPDFFIYGPAAGFANQSDRFRGPRARVIDLGCREGYCLARVVSLPSGAEPFSGTTQPLSK
jgi:hypothetical protein